MSSHILNGNLLPDVPDDALLQRVLPYTYIVVACPFCKAGVGVDCRTPNYSVALSVHAARRKAAWQVGDMDRYRAFAALRAEQVRVREQVEAQLAKPLTADQKATRAAISAAFDEVDRKVRAEEAEARKRCLQPVLHNEACRCRLGEPYVPPAPKPRVVRPVTDLAAARARKAVRA